MLYYRELMNPSDDKNRGPEQTHESENAAVPVETSNDVADLNVEAMDGIIAEIASEQAKENKGDPAGQSSGIQETTQKKDDSTVTDRLALRERLLKAAPKEVAMRAEIVKELEVKKSQLESDIRQYQRRKAYHMLSAAVAQLRAVLRQIEIVAHAGYEVLREIWLKVVHKFA